MAINATYILQENGGLAKLAGQNVWEGQPLTIDAATGQLRAAASTDKVFGLSKIDSNQYADYSFGEFGAYGSGNLDVVTRGQAEVSHSIYQQVEINTQTMVGSSPVVHKLFDDAQTYVPMQPLYVNATGLITNQKVSGVSLFGKCLTNLAAGLSGPLVIEIDPGATHTTADMA